MQVIEDYLGDEPGGPPASSILKDWTDNKSVSEPGPFARNHHHPRRSGASSRESSISEGLVSAEDGGPGKKVVHRYNQTRQRS